MSCWQSTTLAAGWIVKHRLTCLNPSSPPRHPAKALDWGSLRSTEWLNIVTVGSGSTVNRGAELVSRSIFPGLKRPGLKKLESMQLGLKNAGSNSASKSPSSLNSRHFAQNNLNRHPGPRLHSPQRQRA